MCSVDFSVSPGEFFEEVLVVESVPLFSEGGCRKQRSLCLGQSFFWQSRLQYGILHTEHHFTPNWPQKLQGFPCQKRKKINCLTRKKKKASTAKNPVKRET